MVLVKFSGDGACYLHDFVSGCGAPPLNVSGKVFWYVQLFHFGFLLKQPLQSVEIAHNAALITGCLEDTLICTTLRYVKFHKNAFIKKSIL